VFTSRRIKTVYATALHILIMELVWPFSECTEFALTVPTNLQTCHIVSTDERKLKFMALQ